MSSPPRLTTTDAAPGGCGPRGDAGRVSWATKIVRIRYDEKVFFQSFFF